MVLHPIALADTFVAGPGLCNFLSDLIDQTPSNINKMRTHVLKCTNWHFKYAPTSSNNSELKSFSLFWI